RDSGPVPAAPRAHQSLLRSLLGDRILELRGALRPTDRPSRLPGNAAAAHYAAGGRVPGQHGPRLSPGPRPELLAAARGEDRRAGRGTVRRGRGAVVSVSVSPRPAVRASGLPTFARSPAIWLAL